jgi:predicted Zn finger-like uncharacterized protein
MSIRIRCPECRAAYRVDDDLAGTNVKCRECGARVSVPEGDSRGDTRGDDDDDRDRPRRARAKKQGMSVGMILLIVFGSLAVVGCLICGGIGVVAYIGYVKAKDAVEQFQAGAFPALLPEGQGRVLLNQQGRLMPNDPPKEMGPHKQFQVQLEQGKTYVITLSSNEMDSHVFVYDAKGQRLADDDDSGGALNSRLHFTPPQTGNYTIAACSHSRFVPPQGASFTLNVRER